MLFAFVEINGFSGLLVFAPKNRLKLIYYLFSFGLLSSSLVSLIVGTTSILISFFPSYF